MKRFFGLLLVLWVAGCGGRSPNEVPLPLLSPARFGASLTLSQQITVEAFGDTRSFEAVVAISPERVDLAGLAMGRRMIAVHLDGAGLREERNPALPESVSGERILRDLMLAFWPHAALVDALPGGWSVEDSAAGRTVVLNGAPIVSITYTGAPHWRGRTVLIHHRLGYRLTIDSDEA